MNYIDFCFVGSDKQQKLEVFFQQREDVDPIKIEEEALTVFRQCRLHPCTKIEINYLAVDWEDELQENSDHLFSKQGAWEEEGAIIEHIESQGER